jgi:predicted phage terminase large subunit-like protein
MAGEAALRALRPEEVDALIRGDFATFAQVMFAATGKGTQLVWARYLDLIAAMLADVAHGRIKRLVITLPPRHLKSFCVSVALPAFVLGHYPNQEVMCVSYGQDLAREFALGSLALMQSEPYRRAFGGVLASARPGLAAIRTRHGGVRRATSIEGIATGVGGDLIIFDDPQKPGETLSEAIRQSTNEALERTFLSRSNLPGGCRIVIVMQRLHEDDFVGHALGLDSDWEVLNLPAIAEEDQAIAFETFMGPQVFRRRSGEALNPARVTAANFDRIRREVGEAIWASQYQQRPAPMGGGLVQLDWFKRYRDADLPATFDRIIQSWDTANTIAEWSHYSVCTTWGVIGKHLYLLHVYRARLEFPQLCRAAIEQAQLHGAGVVYIEDRASGTQLLQELRAANHGWARPVKPTTDKETRMVNQTALIENGFVHLPESAPWLEAYEHELLTFPNGRFDDQVDSTSQALEALNGLMSWGGLYEFYRQEDEKLNRPPPGDMFVVEGPANAVYDIDGVEFRRQPDGYFYLPRRAALPVINRPGWRVISYPR